MLNNNLLVRFFREICCKTISIFFYSKIIIKPWNNAVKFSSATIDLVDMNVLWRSSNFDTFKAHLHARRSALTCLRSLISIVFPY
jgi:hypothetical protein